MALAMMPRESVIVSFQQIREDSQLLADLPMASLLNYFENTWLSDLDIWNVYADVLVKHGDIKRARYVLRTTKLSKDWAILAVHALEIACLVEKKNDSNLLKDLQFDELIDLIPNRIGTLAKLRNYFEVATLFFFLLFRME